MRNPLPSSKQLSSEGKTPARRDVIAAAFGAVGLGALSASAAEAQQQMNRNAPIPAKDNLKITKLETILVKPRWLFLKIHTNAGIVGLGEPITEGRALTCAEAVKEIEPYLVGKDPRPVAKHWQAIYRHAFYRGGPILTSALSGIDQALWDIKGKALGVPVYELLGGPTRDRVRVYAHASTTAQMKQLQAQGFSAFKTGVAKRRPARYIETLSEIHYAAETFAELRKAMGDEVDIAIDFHGAISPATAKLLIKAYEPYQPMFIEEPCQAQNHDVMADIARGTFLPIATGERVFTKWGFREVLEKKAATVLQPDMCHAGGITEVRLIAGMAEAYYADVAPHNPLGPISLAAGVQLSASIPNFLCQEQVSLGEGYLKQPLHVRDGYLDLPTGPGLGIELDENAMADKIGHDWRNQESYDADDHSVVDW
jgi:galactonate dehydratase